MVSVYFATFKKRKRVREKGRQGEFVSKIRKE
jgi:hypothetical protein